MTDELVLAMVRAAAELAAGPTRPAGGELETAAGVHRAHVEFERGTASRLYAVAAVAIGLPVRPGITHTVLGPGGVQVEFTIPSPSRAPHAFLTREPEAENGR